MELKLSGVSYSEGCIIHGTNHSVNISEQNGRTRYKINKKFNLGINPVLLIFPIADILIFSLPVLTEFIEKIMLQYLPSETTGMLESIPDWAVYVILTVATIFLLYEAIKILLETRKWHGCEHKLINAAHNNDIENARDYPTFADRCGTTYIFTIVIVMLVMIFLFSQPVLTIAGIVMIIESKFFHKYNKIGIEIGRLIQKYNAIEPEGYTMHVGIKGVKELIAIEK